MKIDTLSFALALLLSFLPFKGKANDASNNEDKGRGKGILKIALSKKYHIEIYYNQEHVTLSSNYYLNELHITIQNLGTGEEQEFTIDVLNNETNLPVHLDEGTYSISVENQYIHYSTITNIQ